MKNRIAFLTLLLGATLAGATAMAQTGARFNIPFDFNANHHFVPAGTYNVRLVDAGQKLTLLNLQTGRTTLLMVTRNEGRQLEQTGTLVFWSKDGNYYLQEVRMPGSLLHGELPLPRALQLEIAQLQQPAPPTIQIASK
ncbi:MAG: hypothetical protein ACLGXA_19365 [Acidobacteriota bacterium]